MEPILGDAYSRPRKQSQGYRKALTAVTYLGAASGLSYLGVPFLEPVAELLCHLAGESLEGSPRTRFTAHQILHNHDLALLVGSSIALVLMSVAEEVSPKSFAAQPVPETSSKATSSDNEDSLFQAIHTKIAPRVEGFRRSAWQIVEKLWIQHTGVREERTKLEALAYHAPSFWQERQKELRESIPNFTSIEEKNLVHYFLSQFPIRTEPPSEPAISKEDWAELLTQLEQYTLEQTNKQKRKQLTLEQIQPIPELREKVIETLTTLFPTALREMLKHDFSEGSGKAYVSLQLYMQIFLISLLQEVHADTATIKQQVAELETKLADKIVETLNAEKDTLPQLTLSQILETLQQVQPAILDRLTWIQEKLEAMHGDVQAAHENTQKILADTAEIKQVLKQEYDKEAFFAELRRQARGE